MKTCSRCKVNKDDADFYKNSTRNDGLSYWCKVCHNAQLKKAARSGYESTYNRHIQKHHSRKGIKIGPRLHVGGGKDDRKYLDYYVAPLKETVDKKWSKMLSRLKQNGKVLSG